MRIIDIDPIYKSLGMSKRDIEIAHLIEEAPTIKTKEIKYYDDDDHVWKIGRVIVDE